MVVLCSISPTTGFRNRGKPKLQTNASRKQYCNRHGCLQFRFASFTSSYKSCAEQPCERSSKQRQRDIRLFATHFLRPSCTRAVKRCETMKRKFRWVCRHNTYNGSIRCAQAIRGGTKDRRHLKNRKKTHGKGNLIVRFQAREHP